MAFWFCMANKPSRASPCVNIRGSVNSGRLPVNQDVNFWMIEVDSGTNIGILEQVMLNYIRGPQLPFNEDKYRLTSFQNGQVQWARGTRRILWSLRFQKHPDRMRWSLTAALDKKKIFSVRRGVFNDWNVTMKTKFAPRQCSCILNMMRDMYIPHKPSYYVSFKPYNTYIRTD